MPMWIIPVTVPVFVCSDTLQEAEKELRDDPPCIAVWGEVSYFSSPKVTLGVPQEITKKPRWVK